MYYYNTESLFSYFAQILVVYYTLTRLQRTEETCNKCQIDLNAIACVRIKLLFIYYYTSYYINLIAECHTIFMYMILNCYFGSLLMLQIW